MRKCRFIEFVLHSNISELESCLLTNNQTIILTEHYICIHRFNNLENVYAQSRESEKSC